MLNLSFLFYTFFNYFVYFSRLLLFFKPLLFCPSVLCCCFVPFLEVCFLSDPSSQSAADLVTAPSSGVCWEEEVHGAGDKRAAEYENMSLLG